MQLHIPSVPTQSEGAGPWGSYSQGAAGSHCPQDLPFYALCRGGGSLTPQLLRRGKPVGTSKPTSLASDSMCTAIGKENLTKNIVLLEC